MARLPSLVEKIESLLFHAALSRKEYADYETIKKRVQVILELDVMEQKIADLTLTLTSLNLRKRSASNKDVEMFCDDAQKNAQRELEILERQFLELKVNDLKFEDEESHQLPGVTWKDLNIREHPRDINLRRMGAMARMHVQQELALLERRFSNMSCLPSEVASPSIDETPLLSPQQGRLVAADEDEVGADRGYECHNEDENINKRARIDRSGLIGTLPDRSTCKEGSHGDDSDDTSAEACSYAEDRRPALSSEEDPFPYAEELESFFRAPNSPPRSPSPGPEPGIEERSDLSELLVLKTPLRRYQLRAVQLALQQDLIVVLPTGAGKTLIATAVMDVEAAQGRRSLFLVPTCLLVRQQAAAVRRETGLSVAEFQGGSSAPSAPFQVLVATPTAFSALQAANSAFGYLTFGRVVFDEIHHAVKKHPYIQILSQLNQLPWKAAAPRLLGLSASLTYAIDRRNIAANITNLCAEMRLNVDHAIFTATERELVSDGYHAQAPLPDAEKTLPAPLGGSHLNVDADIPSPWGPSASSTYPDSDSDSGTFADTQAGAITLTLDSSPHESALLLPVGNSGGRGCDLQTVFAHAVHTFSLHPLSDSLVRAIGQVEEALTLIDTAFRSPIPAELLGNRREEHTRAPHGSFYDTNTYNSEGISNAGSAAPTQSSKWGVYCVQQRKRTELPPTAFSLYNILEHMYEALKMLVNSRQAALELAMHYLEMEGVLSVEPAAGCIALEPGSAAPTDLSLPAQLPELRRLQSLWTLQRPQFSRLRHLKEVLLQQYRRFTVDASVKAATNEEELAGIRPGQLRCIVFVQQRVTTHIVQHALRTDPQLVSCLASDVVYASNAAATASLSLSKTRVQAAVERFRSGQINVLIATSMAEEGMDIPAANCVIRFDPITNAVSLVQSRGRARQADSAFVVLRQARGKAVHRLEKAVQEQRRAIASLNQAQN